MSASVSRRRIAAPLRQAGRDVMALAEEPAFEGHDDPEVLALAAHHERILATRNRRALAPILREWAESGRSHAGST